MLDNNNIALCGWDNSSPDLVIPDELDGSIFTEVSNFALRDNTEITSLNMSEAVRIKRIGVMAFSGCTQISNEITIPSGVTMVAAGAFEGCSSIPSVVYDAEVTSVYAQTFNRCTSLKNVRLPNGLQTIEKFAFAECTSLEYLEIPATVTSIAETAFKNDVNLTLGVYYDSYAHQYAKEKGIKYTFLDDYVLGDVNLDGSLTITDVTAIQRYLSEYQQLNDFQLVVADVNSDSTVSVFDATLIQRKLAEFDNP